MIRAIVAMDDNGLIGIDNELPWKLSEDLRWFRNLTNNSVIIMGRKTYGSIIDKNGGPLWYRKHIVLSQKTRPHSPGNNVHYLTTIEDVLDFNERVYPNKDIWVIGGRQIYAEFLERELIEELWITHVHGDYSLAWHEYDLNPEAEIHFPLEYIGSLPKDKNRWNKTYIHWGPKFDRVVYRKV